MQNVLIIKTGAAGDVVRTTVLLHFLKGRVYWITRRNNIPIFPDELRQLILIPVENIPDELSQIDFDLIINLEESLSLAQMAARLKTKERIGVYWHNDMLKYSEGAARWFDMSLISRFGKARADELKRQNQCTYQQMIVELTGFHFTNEPYLIHGNAATATMQPRVGLETRAGERWPNKGWFGFDELEKRFRAAGLEVVNFTQRTSLREYFHDISQCSLIISGDTLAMHVALANKIKCVAIFNCTSPYEIHDYGLLKKVVSPKLQEYFYDTTKIPEAMAAVSVDEVLKPALDSLSL